MLLRTAQPLHPARRLLPPPGRLLPPSGCLRLRGRHPWLELRGGYRRLPRRLQLALHALRPRAQLARHLPRRLVTLPHLLASPLQLRRRLLHLRLRLYAQPLRRYQLLAQLQPLLLAAQQLPLELLLHALVQLELRTHLAHARMRLRVAPTDALVQELQLPAERERLQLCGLQLCNLQPQLRDRQILGGSLFVQAAQRCAAG